MIADIEDAILSHLRAAVNNGPGLGYKVPTIESYGGELDDLSLLAQVIRTMPAIWVAFAGSGKPTPYGASKSKWLVPCTFAVMTGARNIRGERFTRRGLTVGGEIKEVGVYQMVEDVRLLLLRQDFGLAIDRLAPGTVKTLFNSRLDSQSFAIFAQEWHTKFVITDPAVLPDPNGPDWLRLGLNYYLSPDDGIADASDLVTLAP